MTKPTNRPRLRFSIRTLLLVSTAVVLVFGWLGWQVRTVQTRRGIATRLNARQEGKETKSLAIQGDSGDWQVRPFNIIKPPSLVQHPPSESAPLSAIRRWLGDAPYAVVALREAAVCPNARRWFPEATIVEMNRDGVALKGPRKTYTFGPTYQ